MVAPDAPAPPSVRLPAAERRRQLLDRALEIFAVNGFHATSMNDVAEAAGVTKPVLYQHFASKRELYVELLDDVGGRLQTAIVEATAAADGPRQQVEAGFAAYFRHVDGNRSAFTLLFGSGARLDTEFTEAVRRVEASIAEAVATLIDADVDDVHRRIIAFGVVGLAESTSRHWIAEDLDLDPDALARQVGDLAWAGLRGVRPLELREATPAVVDSPGPGHSAALRSRPAGRAAPASEPTAPPQRHERTPMSER